FMAAHGRQRPANPDQGRPGLGVCSPTAGGQAGPRRHDPMHRRGELRVQNYRRLHKPMTSFRQIEVNRNNALRSTGPKRFYRWSYERFYRWSYDKTGQNDGAREDRSSAVSETVDAGIWKS